MADIHCFEKAGLGLAPFRCVGLFSLPSPSLAGENPTAYNNAMALMPRGVGVGSCQYCGTGIMHNFLVQSSDGRRFVVGSDCVARTGDAGLVKQVRAERLKVVREKREEGRRLGREAREALWAAERAERVKTFPGEHAELCRDVSALDVQEGFVWDVVQRGLRGDRMSDRALETVYRVVAEMKRQRELAANSKHVGEAGKRLTFDVQVERVAGYSRPSFSGFGTDWVNIITMRDAQGNALVAKGSFFAEKGKQLKIKATVKEHSEFRGELQTVVQRVKEV